MQLEPRNRKKLAPQRLPEKLLNIRQYIGLSQGKMLRAINPIEKSENNRSRVSQYERCLRVPAIVQVQNYAEEAKIDVGILTDDNLELPAYIKEQPKNSRSKDRRGVTIKLNNPTGEKSSTKKNKKSSSKAKSMNEKPVSKQEFLIPQNDTETKSLTENNLLVDENKSLHLTGENLDAQTVLAETYSIHLPIKILSQCRGLYHELIDQMPFDKISRLSFDTLIENIFTVSFNDYKNRGTESAISNRIRQLIEEE